MDWSTLIEEQKQQDYFQSLLSAVQAEREAGKLIYPPEHQVFSAFEGLPFNDVKVVILGQDPYHGPNQAHGLSFSVLPGVKIPPSLRNMYKELATDIEGFDIPSHGYLQSWLQQGVLLLNAVLTVRDGEPNSHKKLGWGTFTDNMISALSQHREGIVFILWGAFAQKKAELIDQSKHKILTSAHPSPLSASKGFFGNKHFSKANEILTLSGQTPIDWRLPMFV